LPKSSKNEVLVIIQHFIRQGWIQLIDIRSLTFERLESLDLIHLLQLFEALDRKYPKFATEDGIVFRLPPRSGKALKFFFQIFKKRKTAFLEKVTFDTLIECISKEKWKVLEDKISLCILSETLEEKEYD